MAEALAVAGVAIGGTSLAIQLLGGCVKGYRFFLAAEGMPEDCSYLRTRLLIEHNRLCDWSEVAGFTKYQDGDDLPDLLLAHRLVLVAILTEINHSIERLAEFRGKYDELQDDDDSAEQMTDLELIQGLSRVSLEIEKKTDNPKKEVGKKVDDAKKRPGLFHRAKKVLKQPGKSFTWTAFDSKDFTKMLERLAQLNEALEGLIKGQKAKELEATTKKMYLEVVQMRGSLGDLEDLKRAVMLFMAGDQKGSLNSLDRARRHDTVLMDLARFKTINASAKAPSDQRPPPYHDAVKDTQLKYSRVTYTETLGKAATVFRARTMGKDKSDSGDIWIEWRDYKIHYSHKSGKGIPRPKNVERVKELVALLQSQKPDDFLTPRCLGWFDDREDSEQSQHPDRFGLVFKIPDGDKAPISLYQLIESHRKPSLTARMKLAHKIARCLLYLHAVAWLHKALRSDSIVFFSKSKDFNITEPFLTGYDYARPDRDGESTSSTVGQDARWQSYVHPKYQGSLARGHYRKIFDIYSLGIVLLEIAHWKHINEIVKIGPTPTAAEMSKIRELLLEPRERHLSDLLEGFGDSFYEAVKSCLTGLTAFGLGEEEEEGEEEEDRMSPEAGAKLQDAFTTKVVEALDDIRL